MGLGQSFAIHNLMCQSTNLTLNDFCFDFDLTPLGKEEEEKKAEPEEHHEEKHEEKADDKKEDEHKESAGGGSSDGYGSYDTSGV